MRYCSSITSGRSNLLVCIYFKLIANVHVTTNGWKTSVTFGTGNGHDVDNEDLPEDNDADGELLNVSALRTGLHQMQNCTGILQRIIRGGGEVWGADPGVIEMITTQPATMLPGMHNTQREAERAGRAAGGRRVSNGLYSKLLLTDLRTNEMDFENRRRFDGNSANLQEIYAHLSENEERSTPDQIARLFNISDDGHLPNIVLMVHYITRPFYQKWKSR